MFFFSSFTCPHTLFSHFVRKETLQSETLTLSSPPQQLQHLAMYCVDKVGSSSSGEQRGRSCVITPLGHKCLSVLTLLGDGGCDNTKKSPCLRPLQVESGKESFFRIVRHNLGANRQILARPPEPIRKHIDTGLTVAKTAKEPM